jgi:indole-3-acetate monooxygenase
MPEIPTTTMKHGPRDKDATPLLTRARALAPSLPSYRAEHDLHKQLAPPVTNALRDGGFLCCLAPREVGGSQLSVREYLEVVEAIALGDSAAAWCVMTAATSALLTTYLPRATTEELWRECPPFLAGIFAPSGTLVPAADGKSYRLTGHWSYASGSRHADWFVVGAMLDKRHHVCVLPASQVTVIDNWNTLGLAGTGSHDILIDGATLPADRVSSMFERRSWSDAPIYRVPVFGLLACGIAAVALGIAGAALERAATELIASCPPPSPSKPHPSPPSSSLARYATGRAQLDAARAYLYSTATVIQAHAAEAKVDPVTRADFRLAATHVSQQCAEITRAAFHLTGGTAIRADHPIGAALRDIETLCTHKMVTDRGLPAFSRAILGLGPVAPEL